MEATVLDKRFVVVSGKGGVGKSTICAALGLATARHGRRTVIAELNTREKAPIFFGKRPSGYETREIYPNLYSINIQPDPALREYALMKLKFERAYKVVFENDAMKRFLRAVPGMNELFVLGKAFHMERDRRPDGRPTWDTIIVDAPATGHGVSLLRLPEAILGVVKTGPMAEEVMAMRDLLTDRKRSVMHVVSLAEEMPVRETFDLLAQMETVLHVSPGALFVNQIWPQLFTPREQTFLRTLRNSNGDDQRLRAAVACGDTMQARRKLQDHYLRELASGSDLPTVQVPYIFDRDFGLKAITQISDHITAEAERIEVRRQSTRRSPKPRPTS